jgi:hypothetical protein
MAILPVMKIAPKIDVHRFAANSTAKRAFRDFPWEKVVSSFFARALRSLAKQKDTFSWSATVIFPEAVTKMRCPAEVQLGCDLFDQHPFANQLHRMP